MERKMTKKLVQWLMSGGDDVEWHICSMTKKLCGN